MSLARAWLVGAALIVMALVAERLGYWVPLPPTRIRAFGVNQTVRVVRVSDGDTVVLSDGRRVDLVGIEAPEGRELGSSIARAALTAWLLEGRTVALRACSEQPENTDNRTLGQLWIDGVDVQLVLVQNGMARAVARPPCGREQTEALTQAQVQAAQAGLGLWALAARLPACDSDDWVGRWVWLEGEVRAVRLKDNELSISWAGDKKRCGYVTVSGRTLWAGGEASQSPFVVWADPASPSYLVGRSVRVLGKLERAGKRTEIRLSHPSELTYN